MSTSASAGERTGAPTSRAERADAARNRTRILTAAEELVALKGVGALTMNEVAAAASVGVGTVYRRFGDQGGLVEAMMDEREHRLQDAMTSGRPPLGPGAPAVERIRAFLHAYVDLLETYGSLMAAAEATMSPDRRYRSGPYTAHRQHLIALIRQARPDADAPYLAQALLEPLSASHYTHQRERQGMSPERIKAGLDDLMAGLPPVRFA
ncbi:DNA-binding transcriptional regulator, AcrR family [Brevibacterium sandarakinum]|uniref:DNA-binding transcriptional regulator, AcrR family n=1 Tax=Brevibacterium sandarakinum TaxID=629680 RepID=A0A1H1P154_BRESA|nr:TetR/AcrR family transcriptional regulator [Brevibacterium sandarakinum]SDS04745.1 DNA-binding transcriptional regulator, AcrR family [Brevibacterium sandarakinum]